MDLENAASSEYGMFQLEMERALLEGEHNMEMSELQMDQEKIAALKQKQWELIDLAAIDRERVSSHAHH